jgi:hypothetical protein
MNKCLKCQKDCKNKYCSRKCYRECSSNYNRSFKSNLKDANCKYCGSAIKISLNLDTKNVKCAQCKHQYVRGLTNCLKCDVIIIKTQNRRKYCSNCFVDICKERATIHNKRLDRSFQRSIKWGICRCCGLFIFVNSSCPDDKATCYKCKPFYKFIFSHPKKSFKCKRCDVIIHNIRKEKYCSECRMLRQQENGRKNAASQYQLKRSWSEIQFGNLCKEKFNHVTFNDPIFPHDPPTGANWDADVLIHDYKIAVLWNGPWHYRKLMDTHRFKQTQIRDCIKIDRIKAYGWEPFVIEDKVGKKSIDLVNKYFTLLLKKLGL